MLSHTCARAHTRTPTTLDTYLETIHLEENARRSGEIELEGEHQDSSDRCLNNPADRKLYQGMDPASLVHCCVSSS